MLTADSATEAAWRHEALSQVANWHEASQIFNRPHWAIRCPLKQTITVEIPPGVDWFDAMQMIAADLKAIRLGFSTIRPTANNLVVDGIHILGD